MTRAVEEWIGKNDDSAIPPRVMLRVYTRAKGLCEKCSRNLRHGKWACDHVIALANGGRHAESNLQALCVSPCHSDKTKSDVAEKSKVYAIRSKHLGVKAKQSRPMPGSIRSGLRKKMNGQVERR